MRISRIFFPLFSLIVFLSISNVNALDIELVEDLNLTPQADDPRSIVPFGQEYLVTANKNNLGVELYLNDGTAGNLELIKDINPGSGFSFPGSITVGTIGGTLVAFFTATTEDEGTELWITDGTEVGTVLVKDIQPGEDSSGPANLFFDQSKEVLLFSANNGTDGVELWKSDGTTVGTVQVLDIQSGSGSSSPREFTATTSGIAFTADDDTNGRELWLTTSPYNTATIVKDILPGAGNSNPTWLEWNSAIGMLYFACITSGNGVELCSSDLTSGGTGLFLDINSGSTGSSPSYITSAGPRFFFAADDGSNGRELWVSDGTVPNTNFIDVESGSDGSSPSHLFRLRQTVFFRAKTAAHGTELWRANATTATRLSDINPGPEDTFISNQTLLKNTLFFRAHKDDGTGEELFSSDGTPAGTGLYADLHPVPGGSSQPSTIITNGTDLIVLRNQPYPIMYKVANGAGDPTVFLDFAIPGKTDNSDAQALGALGDTLIFSADDGIIGDELYARDPDGSIRLIKDIQPGFNGSNPDDGVVLGDQLIFTAFTDGEGEELWRTDGTTAGTFLLRDIFPGTDSSSIRKMTAAGSYVFFQADDGTNGVELWKSDGTVAGTELVKDIFPGSDSSEPDFFAPLGDDVLFRAEASNGEGELWISDGTAAGTILLKDIEPTFGSYPMDLTTFGNSVVFVAETDADGEELWITDGTSGGTKLLKDINLGAGPSDCGDLIVVGDLLFFQANDSTNGRELWKTDGTTAGTVLVKDILPGPDGQGNMDPVAGNSLLFFTGDDGVSGEEPWVSDGTPGGTFMLKDIVPGSDSSDPEFFIAFDNRALFEADTDAEGEEIWVTDGTPDSTMLIKDLKPGEDDANAYGFVALNGIAFFTAEDDIVDEELWMSVVDECPVDTGKLEAGICGCGISDVDSDGDNTADCNETCPDDSSKLEAGQCGCGVADTDGDGDGTADCLDLCPADGTKTEPGTCGCGTADADLRGANNRSNGIIDCLFSEEFNSRIDELLLRVKRLVKSGDTKKKKKRARQRKKEARTAFNDLKADFEANSLNITAGDGVDLDKLYRKAKKAVKKSLRIGSPNIKKNKKQARKKLKKLQAGIV